MISGFDFETPLADRRRGRAPTTRATRFAEVPVAALPGARRPALPGHRRAEARHGSATSTNFMPRAGFSWQPEPKTAVRGGYGLFYDVLGPNRINANQTGYSRTTALTPSLDNGQTFVATLANPFPNGLLEPVGSGLGLMTNVGLGVSFPYVGEVQTPRHAPLVARHPARAARGSSWSKARTWSARSQNTPGHQAAELGARPVLLHLAGARRCDEQLPDAAGAEPVRRPAARARASTAPTSRARSCCGPIPQFTGSPRRSRPSARPTTRRSRAASSAAWPTASRVQVAYTWSKTMTETGYLNAFDTELERVIGPFDRTHVFVTSGIVELPFGRDRRWGRDWNGVTDGAARRLAGRRSCSRRRAARRSASATSSSPTGATVDDIVLPGDPRRDQWFNVDAFNRVDRAAAGVERADAAEPLRRGARAGLRAARPRVPEERQPRRPAASCSCGPRSTTR